MMQSKVENMLGTLKNDRMLLLLDRVYLRVF